MVYIFLAPGFEEAEALIPADLLRRAGIETALVTIAGDPVIGGHGIAVLPDMDLSQVDLDDADMLVLPGGARGVDNLAHCQKAEQLIRHAFAQKIWVAAICAAPTLLARWGLLKGREAVCYPGMDKPFADQCSWKDSWLVADDHLITARGPGAAFDFGSSLVEQLAGPLKASEVRVSVCL